MESIWMGIAQGTATTRVLAMAGPGETLLKGMLRGAPSHPRALPTLLEAVALARSPGPRCALCGREAIRSVRPSLTLRGTTAARSTT